MTQEEFIKRLKVIYGDKYDYSKIVYKGVRNKVILVDKCTKKEIIIKPKKILYKKKYNRITNEERVNTFIKKSKEKFGDKFDYSKVRYVDSHTLVTLICKEHGEFDVNMYRHLYSKDGLCPMCCKKNEMCDRGGRKQLSTDYIIKKCKKFYGDKYDYSKVEYSGGKLNTEIIEIICPIHGSFFKRVTSIDKRNCGCPMCTKERKRLNDIISNTKNFIEKSKSKFGNKFDYSEVKYVNSWTPITLICKEHDIRFSITPSNHLIKKFGGCKMCHTENLKKSNKPKHLKLTEEERKERRTEFEKNRFIKKAINKFGNRFDFSGVKYVNSNTLINIADKASNNEIFSVKPSSFLNSVDGRPDKRKANKTAITTNQFIERARSVHGNKYDYSKVEYKKWHEKVCIICPIHGEFWQTPGVHLNVMRNGCGCPKCSHRVSKLEENIINRLKKENISFKTQYINKEIFGKMRGDFFIEFYNVIIECQGKQHFEENNSFHGAYGGNLSGQLKRDYNFNKCCKNANIKLFYYFNKDNVKNVDYLNDKKFNGIYTKKNTFTDIDNLISCIKQKK